MTFATSMARALLVYVAMQPDRPLSREQLAALLWPDQPQASAYTNLRQTLARLRKAFPDPVGLDEPFAIYLTRYRVFEATNDPRSIAVVQMAVRLLHTYADAILDHAQRQTFLQEVATHRELLDIFEQISVQTE